MFKHLLVPLDGSRLAEAALPAAILVSQKSGAKVTLLHVIERHAPKSVHGNVHLRTPEEAEAYLRRLAEERFPPGVEVDWHVHRRQTDHLAQSLADHVEELDLDLIVMVAHGRRRLEQWLFGTVSQQLLRENATPVLLVQPDPEASAPAFREILVPLDGQPEHEAGLPVAAELARLFQASLRLLMVVPTRGVLAGEEAATGQLLPAATSELLDLAAERGAEYLGGHLRRLEDQGIQAGASLARGDPVEQIELSARQYRADIVVMSTHGAAGTKAFWSGSLGQRLIARLHVAFLLVPAPVASAKA